MDRPNNKSILRWLEYILFERYGHKFALEKTSTDRISIKNTVSNRYITILFGLFEENNAVSNIPCTYWEPEPGFKSAMGTPIPAPGFAVLSAPLIKPTDYGFHIDYDVLGLTYWMLNRVEEQQGSVFDCHGRFPATASHAYMHGYLERPVVDEWLIVLKQVIHRVWPMLELKQPHFSVMVSHDVDHPSMYAFKSWGMVLRIIFGHLIKRKDLRAAIQAIYLKSVSRREISVNDPYNTFDWIMDQSERKGIKSTFFFICGNSDPHDAEYGIEDPRIRSLIRRIHERGHEIGLHPSYGSFLNPEMICREWNRLKSIAREESIEQEEWGARMHYLRWRHPNTLRALDSAGVDYDTSLGYADHPGFRCGTCFEFSGYDNEAKKILKTRLRPLVMMECSLIDKKYLGLGNGKEAIIKAMSLIDACKKVGGTFTLLWHNSSLLTENDREFYMSLINSEKFND